jgi:hypothetical protein
MITPQKSRLNNNWKASNPVRQLGESKYNYHFKTILPKRAYNSTVSQRNFYFGPIVLKRTGEFDIITIPELL